MSGGRIRSVRLKDGLGAAFASLGSTALQPYMGGARILPGFFTHQLAIAAYMASGMLRKVITIPAEDRIREWRDWQAENVEIEAIEKEEERLGLQAKVLEAEMLRGIGGGALVIVTAGDHSQPLLPEQVAKGGIVAINVVSRWQITGKDWIKELSSPDYGSPAMWEMESQSGPRVPIHPSRVICFRGGRMPAGGALDDADTFWGDSKLLRVYSEVARSDDVQAWFAALVRKAKLLRFGVSNLGDYDQDQLNKRVGLIAMGESITNATIYSLPTKDGAGSESGGEKIDDYQVTWAGIPAMMDAFDQRVAAVSDIPFTRLTGRSPAGMNATGQHDLANWNRMVVSGQKLETRPCLNLLDPYLLASAGVPANGDIWWEFAPLDTPTEKEVADTFFTTMQAVEKLQATNAVPDEAFAKGLQNLLVERAYLPGLEAALAEIPEAERYGINPEPDNTDPSAIQSRGGDPELSAERGGSGSGAARRAANDAATWLADAEPRPLYVQRKLLNASELIAWAKSNGFETTLPAGDMHVTVLYSRSPVDPMKMGRSWAEDEKGQMTVRPGGPRVIERLGENAVVLRFASPDLEYRHREMIEAGGSHDYPEYQSHVTISYDVPDGVDVEAIKPFNGSLRFGPEEFSALDLGWKSKIEER